MIQDLNPQAAHMADESMVRTLAAQADAIWPQEVEIVRRHALPPEPAVLDAGCGTGEATRRVADALPRSRVLGVDILDAHLERTGQLHRFRPPPTGFRQQQSARDFTNGSLDL